MLASQAQGQSLPVYDKYGEKKRDPQARRPREASHEPTSDGREGAKLQQQTLRSTGRKHPTEPFSPLGDGSDDPLREDSQTSSSRDGAPLSTRHTTSGRARGRPRGESGTVSASSTVQSANPRSASQGKEISSSEGKLRVKLLIENQAAVVTRLLPLEPDSLEEQMQALEADALALLNRLMGKNNPSSSLHEHCRRWLGKAAESLAARNRERAAERLNRNAGRQWLRFQDEWRAYLDQPEFILRSETEEGYSALQTRTLGRLEASARRFGFEALPEELRDCLNFLPMPGCPVLTGRAKNPPIGSTQATIQEEQTLPRFQIRLSVIRLLDVRRIPVLHASHGVLVARRLDSTGHTTRSQQFPVTFSSDESWAMEFYDVWNGVDDMGVIALEVYALARWGSAKRARLGSDQAPQNRMSGSGPNRMYETHERNPMRDNEQRAGSEKRTSATANFNVPSLSGAGLVYVGSVVIHLESMFIAALAYHPANELFLETGVVLPAEMEDQMAPLYATPARWASIEGLAGSGGPREPPGKRGRLEFTVQFSPDQL